MQRPAAKGLLFNIPTDQSKIKIPLFSCHYTCYKLAEFSLNIKADSIIVTNSFWSAAHLQFSFFFLFFWQMYPNWRDKN